MKKLSKILLPLFLLLFIMGCSSRKNIVRTNNSVNEFEKQYPQAVIGSFLKHSDPFTIKNIDLNKNLIEIEVIYTGGCQVHNFQLIGSDILTKSIPPIRNVQLVHINKGDNCKAIVTEKIKFNISELAENHELGNKIKLKFENYSEIIEYSYK